MIGRIQGVLLEKLPPQLLVDVSGVGYDIEASMNTIYRLPAVGQNVVLHTHMVVREDAQLLYGFIDKQERLLFRALIKVNGVGPKLAITILSGISVSEFIQAVHHNDTAALVRLPGVGKKTAERLLIEMSDRLKDLEMTSPADFQLEAQDSGVPLFDVEPARDVQYEAESALVALGYKPAQAAKAISQALKQLDADASSESVIRQALKSMVKG